MILRIASPKEFWAGLIYLLFGSCVILLARDYEMGTATRMGPAYFPTILGWLLVGIGLLALGRGVKVKGPAIEPVALRPLIITIGSTLLFAATVRGLGLTIALPVYTLLTAWASPRFRLVSTLILAAVLTLFCCLIFVKGLSIPLPLIGPWILSFVGETGS
ncbi:tripartite tricarboxylate transporter TctB family protein [Oligoflexus tunisiensis]|uniref:tripartite tricarboxylate transporter TctB family protein n=1 Tax=Oligoflexus tunisiensis TaxID=708132 RepID=UPI00114CA2F4|nr:tripartite tricarboxylate transporter TctB family protein [Oligoflexus tunisiensis]